MLRDANPCLNQNSQHSRNYLLQLLGMFTVPVSLSQVRLVHGIPRGWGGTRPPLAIVDQTVDHFTPVAGIEMRL